MQSDTASAPPDMVEGYKDGLNPDSPPPSDNRSHSYRHGFANGRDDLRKQPRASASSLRLAAQEAIAKDRDGQRIIPHSPGDTE